MTDARSPGLSKRARNLLAASIILLSSGAAALILSSDPSAPPTAVEPRGPASEVQAVAAEAAPLAPPPVPSIEARTEGDRVKPRPSVPVVRKRVQTNLRGTPADPWSPEKLEALRKNPPPEFAETGNKPGRSYRGTHSAPKATGPIPGVARLARISSLPPGMRVELNGMVVGRTPYAHPLPPDTESIDAKISGLGYLTEQKKLTPDEDGVLNWSVIMTPDPKEAQAKVAPR